MVCIGSFSFLRLKARYIRLGAAAAALIVLCALPLFARAAPGVEGPYLEIPFGVHTGKAEVALPVPAVRAALVFQSSEPGALSVAPAEQVLDLPLEKVFRLAAPSAGSAVSSVSVTLAYPASAEIHLRACLVAEGRLEGAAERGLFSSRTSLVLEPVTADGGARLLADPRFSGRSVAFRADGQAASGIVEDGVIRAEVDATGAVVRVSDIDFEHLGFRCEGAGAAEIPVDSPAVFPYVLAFLAAAVLVALLALIRRKKARTAPGASTAPIRPAPPAKPAGRASSLRFRGRVALYVMRTPDGREIEPAEVDLAAVRASRLTLTELLARMGVSLPLPAAEKIAFSPRARGMCVENGTEHVVTKGPHPLEKGACKDFYYGETLYVGTHDAAMELLLQYGKH